MTCHFSVTSVFRKIKKIKKKAPLGGETAITNLNLMTSSTIRFAFANPISLPLSKTTSSLPTKDLFPRRPNHPLSMSTTATTPVTNSNNAKAINPARTVVITGASGGIGAETCKGLIGTLPNLEKLILCCRDVAKGESVVETLMPLTSKSNMPIDIQVVPVDLSDSESVTHCIDELSIKLDNKPLDLLICNAGIMACPLAFSKATKIMPASTSAQSTMPESTNAISTTDTSEISVSSQSSTSTPSGTVISQIEQQYFVNFLSHALMTERLLPLLKKSATPRIVYVSSIAVSISRRRKAPPLVAEKTSDAVTNGNYSRWGAYGDSKLAMSLYARGVASHHQDIESISLHPGVVQTELFRHFVPRWMEGKVTNFVTRLFGMLTPEQGAALSIELGSAGYGELENGQLYLGLGGKLAAKSIIPLLDNQDAVDSLYTDAKSFIGSLV